MTHAHTLETLQHAVAHLLLMAEDAPRETAKEMREVAARLQALCFSPFFETEYPETDLAAEPLPAE